MFLDSKIWFPASQSDLTVVFQFQRAVHFELDISHRFALVAGEYFELTKHGGEKDSHLLHGESAAHAPSRSRTEGQETVGVPLGDLVREPSVRVVYMGQVEIVGIVLDGVYQDEHCSS
jgi:hypothetical protein